MKVVMQLVFGGILALGGCAGTGEPPAVPVQPVSIKAETFCEVLCRLYPRRCFPTWDVADLRETIDGIRRLEAAVKKRQCHSVNPQPKTS